MDDEEGEYLFDYGISEVLTQDECLPTEEGIQAIFSRLYDVEDIIDCFKRLTSQLCGEPTWEVGLKSLIVINRLLGAAAANLSRSFLDRLAHFINCARNSHYFRYSDGYSDPNIRIYFDFISTWVSYFVKRLECFSRFQFDVVTYRSCAKGLDHAGLSLQLPSLQDLLSKALRCQTQGSLIHNPLVQALLAVVAEDSLKIQNAIREFSDLSTVRVLSAIPRHKPDYLDIAITTATADIESSVEEKHINAVFRSVSDLDTLDDCISAFAQSLENAHNWVVAVKILFVIHHALKKMDPQFCANLIVYIRIHNILEFCIGKNPSQKYRTDGELVDVYCEWIRTYASYLQNRLDFSSAQEYNIATEPMKAKELDIAGLFAHMEALLELCRRALCCHSQGAEVHNSLIQSTLSVVESEIVEIYNAIRDGLTTMVKTLPELQPRDDHKVCKIKRLVKQQVGELKKLFNPASEIHNLPAEVELFLDKVIDVADEKMKINEDMLLVMNEVTNSDTCLPKKHIQAILSCVSDRSFMKYCIRYFSHFYRFTFNWVIAVKCLFVMHHILGVVDLDQLLIGELISIVTWERPSEYSCGYITDPQVCRKWVYTYVSYFIKRLEYLYCCEFDVVTYRSSAKDVDAVELLVQLPALQDLLSCALQCLSQGAVVHHTFLQSSMSLVAEESIKIHNAIRDLSDFQVVKAGVKDFPRQQQGIDFAFKKAIESLGEERNIHSIFHSLSDMATLDDWISYFASCFGNEPNLEVVLENLVSIHLALRELEPPFHVNLIVYIRIYNILGKFRSDEKSVEVNAEWFNAYASYLQNRLEFSSVLKYDIVTDLTRTKELDTAGLLERMQALLKLSCHALHCYSQGAGLPSDLFDLSLSVVASEIAEIYDAIKDGLATMVKSTEFQRHDDDKVCHIKGLAKQQVSELKKVFNSAPEIHNLPVEVELFLDKVDVADEKKRSMIYENFEFDVPLKRQRIKEEWASRELGFEPRTPSEHQQVGNMDCGCPIADF